MPESRLYARWLQLINFHGIYFVRKLNAIFYCLQYPLMSGRKSPVAIKLLLSNSCVIKKPIEIFEVFFICISEISIEINSNNVYCLRIYQARNLDSLSIRFSWATLLSVISRHAPTIFSADSFFIPVYFTPRFYISYLAIRTHHALFEFKAILI